MFCTATHSQLRVINTLYSSHQTIKIIISVLHVECEVRFSSRRRTKGLQMLYSIPFNSFSWKNLSDSELPYGGLQSHLKLRFSDAQNFIKVTERRCRTVAQYLCYCQWTPVITLTPLYGKFPGLHKVC